MYNSYALGLLKWSTEVDFALADHNDGNGGVMTLRACQLFCLRSLSFLCSSLDYDSGTSDCYSSSDDRISAASSWATWPGFVYKDFETLETGNRWCHFLYI